MGDTLDEKEGETTGNKPNYYSKMQSYNSMIFLLMTEPTECCNAIENQLYLSITFWSEFVFLGIETFHYCCLNYIPIILLIYLWLS